MTKKMIEAGAAAIVRETGMEQDRAEDLAAVVYAAMSAADSGERQSDDAAPRRNAIW
jgi:hypothetical protein